MAVTSTENPQLYVGTANVIAGQTRGCEVWQLNGTEWSPIVHDEGEIASGFNDGRTIGARSIIEYPEGSSNVVVGTYNVQKLYHEEKGCEVWIREQPLTISKSDSVSHDKALEQHPQFPVRFCLFQNYPNPFNPVTTIEFGLPEPGYVTADIYNILGAKVTTLFAGYKPAGYHKLTWNASGFASGIYFFRLTAGEQALTRKMHLLK